MENHKYNFYLTKISKYNIPLKCTNDTVINGHVNVANDLNFGYDYVSQISCQIFG